MKQIFTVAAISIALLAAGCSSDGTPASQAPIAPLATSPTTAPTNPTEVAATSIFSGGLSSLSTLSGLNLLPNWNQGTVASIENIAGNDVLKLAGLDYHGIEFGSSIDVSVMDSLHIDYFTSESTGFNVFPISAGLAPANEVSSFVQPSNGEWNSIDIPLSNFDGSAVDLSQLAQLKFVGDGDVFLDNIYFYHSNTGRQTLAAFSETSTHTNTAPTVSFLSSSEQGWGGNTVSFNQSSAAVVAADGSESLEIDWQSPLTDEWGGTVMTFATPVDVSSYTNLVMSVNMSQLTVSGDVDLHIKLEDSIPTSGISYVSTHASTSTISGDWQTIKMPLSSFSGVNLSDLKSIGFWNPENNTYATGVQNMSGKIYFDDIYFEGPINPLPTPVRTGSNVYSETNTTDSLTSSMINTADWGGNAVNNDLVSSAITSLDGGVVLASEFVSPASAPWGGVVFDFASVDVSGNTELSFAIDTSAMTGFQDMQVKLEDDAATGVVVYLSDYTPISQGAWSVYTIPLTDFPGVDLTTLKFLGFWNPSNIGTGVAGVPTSPAELSTGTMYFDDIHFATSPVVTPPSSTDLGVFSETYASNALTFSMINTADWGGSAVNNDQMSTAVSAADGSVVLASEFVSPAIAPWGGVVFDFVSADVSGNTELSFAIDTSAMTGFQDMQVKLEDGAATGVVVYLSDYTPISQGAWSVYTIPLEDFSGVDLTTLKFLGFWNPSNIGTGVAGVPTSTAELSTGTMYLDNIHFTD